MILQMTTFGLKDLDSLFDETSINNMHKFAKTVESIFNATTDKTYTMQPTQSTQTATNNPTGIQGIPYDLVTSGYSYLILFDIPGSQKKNINISNSQTEIIVRVDRNARYFDIGPNDHDDINIDILTNLRYSGKYEQVVKLPLDSDMNDISAVYQDGVLRVRVGKLAQTKFESKTIPIS